MRGSGNNRVDVNGVTGPHKGEKVGRCNSPSPLNGQTERARPHSGFLFIFVRPIHRFIPRPLKVMVGKLGSDQLFEGCLNQ